MVLSSRYHTYRPILNCLRGNQINKGSVLRYIFIGKNYAFPADLPLNYPSIEIHSLPGKLHLSATALPLARHPAELAAPHWSVARGDD